MEKVIAFKHAFRIKGIINKYPCKTGKVIYANRKIAWEAALFYRKRGMKGSGSYKCKLCKKFHLTSHGEHFTPPKKIIHKFK